MKKVRLQHRARLLAATCEGRCRLAGRLMLHTRTPLADCRARMVSPPRPMMRPTMPAGQSSSSLASSSVSSAATSARHRATASLQAGTGRCGPSQQLQGFVCRAAPLLPPPPLHNPTHAAAPCAMPQTPATAAGGPKRRIEQPARALTQTCR